MRTIQELNQFIGDYFQVTINNNEIDDENGWIDFCDGGLDIVTIWKHFEFSIDIDVSNQDAHIKAASDLSNFMGVSFYMKSEHSAWSNGKVWDRNHFHDVFYFVLTEQQKLEYHMMYFS